jgi:hypothetical protein
MARLLDQDLLRFRKYLDEYSLKGAFDSKTKDDLLRRAHKHCLAALQMWAVIDGRAQAGKLQICGLPLVASSPAFDQLEESFSDMVGALFATTHGLNKPAHLALRSSVECLVRCLTGIYKAEALATTSVYRLFTLAKGCPPFTGRGQPHFQTLHQQYADLCLHAHAATPKQMAKIHALSSFPKQDVERLRDWVLRSEAITSSALAILTFSNTQLFLDSPPRVHDIYEMVIPKSARLYALGKPE